jgi:uncharacterized membrane protein
MTDDSGRRMPASTVVLVTESQCDAQTRTSPPSRRFSTPRGHESGVEAGVDGAIGERLSFGDLVADRVTKEIGSWRFILAYFVLLTLWMVVNTVAWLRHWDPYPFIFLNLVLSFQGAFAAPILLMSQNRQEKKDRFAEACDHAVNLQAEQVVESMQARIEELGKASMAEIASLRDGHHELFARIDTLVVLLERDRSTTET